MGRLPSVGLATSEDVLLANEGVRPWVFHSRDSQTVRVQTVIGKGCLRGSRHVAQPQITGVVAGVTVTTRVLPEGPPLTIVRTQINGCSFALRVVLGRSMHSATR